MGGISTRTHGKLAVGGDARQERVPSCQDSYQATKLPGYQATKLPGYQATKLPSYQARPATFAQSRCLQLLHHASRSGVNRPRCSIHCDGVANFGYYHNTSTSPWEWLGGTCGAPNRSNLPLARTLTLTCARVRACVRSCMLVCALLLARARGFSCMLARDPALTF